MLMIKVKIRVTGLEIYQLQIYRLAGFLVCMKYRHMKI